MFVGRSMFRVRHEAYRGSSYVRVVVPDHATPEQDDAAHQLADRIAEALEPERGLLGPQLLALAQVVAGTTPLAHEDVPPYRQGANIDKHYADALFAIPEVGRTSNAVRTKWGWDVIAWTADVPAASPSDDDVARELMPDVKRDVLRHLGRSDPQAARHPCRACPRTSPSSRPRPPSAISKGRDDHAVRRDLAPRRRGDAARDRRRVRRLRGRDGRQLLDDERPRLGCAHGALRRRALAAHRGVRHAALRRARVLHRAAPSRSRSSCMPSTLATTRCSRAASRCRCRPRSIICASQRTSCAGRWREAHRDDRRVLRRACRRSRAPTRSPTTIRAARRGTAWRSSSRSPRARASR